MSGGPVPVWKKYTTGSSGIWETIRKTLTLVPNRSSGNPYVPYYRTPAPSSEKMVYKDPRTVPAGDIAGNQYYDRDHRRNYPRISSFNQSKVSALLKLGNEANPRISIGEKGQKELSVYTGDSPVYLSTTLSSVPANVLKGELLGTSGQPVVAPNMNKAFKLRVLTGAEHGMFEDDKYPVRVFGDRK